MEDSKPSQTAAGAALHRAAHQIVDRPPVFEDPLALAIMGPNAENVLLTKLDPDLLARGRGLRAFIATRSRFAEDRLAEAFARGTRQYVLLGAGFDTFGYRSGDRFPGLTVFEIDHPATQAWKRERLGKSAIAIPGHVVFAPIDFEREALDAALTRAGFDLSAPAFFAWLGVVPYLTREAVLATLAFIARTKANEVVFEYVEPEQAWDTSGKAAFSALAERTAAAGEPLQSHFEPEDLAKEMRGLGFSCVEDLERDVLNAMYFKDRADGLQLRGHAHLIHACV